MQQLEFYYVTFLLLAILLEVLAKNAVNPPPMRAGI